MKMEFLRRYKHLLNYNPTSFQKAVFLDRDGTLNDTSNTTGYIGDPAEFKLFPEVLEALALLKRAGFLMFIFTNQSGIGRGLFSLADFWKVQSKLERILAERGIHLLDTLFCPHAPDEGCPCRKPSPYLLELAVRRYHLNRAESWVVGDSERDVVAGLRAGLKVALISRGEPVSLTVKPHIIASDLLEFSKEITKNP